MGVIMSNNNLELGKCGEYYSIYEIIKQGKIAFLSDQGLPYDIIVDHNGYLLKGQVKSTIGHQNYGKSANCLRFGTRSGKGCQRRASSDLCDFYAFVSINDKIVSFFHISELESKTNIGTVKQTIDLRSRHAGFVAKGNNARMLIAEDYASFERVIEIHESISKNAS